MTDLWFRLVVGVALMEAVLLGFLWFGSDGSGLLLAVSAGVAVYAIYLIGRYYLTITGLADLYKVARQIVPSFEKQYYLPVDFGKVRAEVFKGYFLMEYWNDNLTVAWDAKLGVVARQRMTLEQFKKGFNPELLQPTPVVIDAQQQQQRVVSSEEGVE